MRRLGADCIQVPDPSRVYPNRDRAVHRGRPHSGPARCTYGINDQTTINELLDVGVDGVTSDRVRLLRGVPTCRGVALIRRVRTARSSHTALRTEPRPGSYPLERLQTQSCSSEPRCRGNWDRASRPAAEPLGEYRREPSAAWTSSYKVPSRRIPLSSRSNSTTRSAPGSVGPACPPAPARVGLNVRRGRIQRAPCGAGGDIWPSTSINSFLGYL
jgi:hypothetical protein